MLHRSLLRIAVFCASLALVFGTFHAGAQEDHSRRVRKMKVPPQSSRIEITVLRDSNGEPIEHAAVIFHPILGDRDNGVMELKTNEDGKAMVDVIPMGDTVRLQIIAKGFQTYGSDFKVDKLEIAKEIRLKRPGQQYSIYRDSKAGNADNSKSDGSSADANSQKPAQDQKPKDQAAPNQQ